MIAPDTRVEAMPHYRLYVMRHGTHVSRAVDIECETDEEAIEAATRDHPCCRNVAGEQARQTDRAAVVTAVASPAGRAALSLPARARSTPPLRRTRRSRGWTRAVSTDDG
jgi:hypothetical protein